MTIFRPENCAEAREMVASAHANGEKLEIVAGASKSGLGRAERPADALDVGRIAGIIDYDPPELVLTAYAATPMLAIAAQLAAHRQTLAFEPPDWRGLWDGAAPTDRGPTLGGVIACNIAGPRRVRAGAARDHFLGFAAIDGRGNAWKAGGRVVKNVTGFDMCKLQCGAFGTLSVLTELTVRVVPLAETACTVLFAGLDDERAVPLMAQALNLPLEVSAAAHLPAPLARRSSVDAIAGAGCAITALRLEGQARSVASRANSLIALGPQPITLDAAATATLWHEIGGVGSLLRPAGACVWRLCPTPSQAAGVVHQIRTALLDAEVFYDWGGGLVWLAVDAARAGADAGAGVIRGALRHAGGHATLVAAPEALRMGAAVFDPEPLAIAALADRLKTAFDPNRVLNPGRIQQGR